MDGKGGAVGSAVVTAAQTLVSPPPNDDFAPYTKAASFPMYGTTLGATLQAREPGAVTSTSGGTASIWYWYLVPVLGGPVTVMVRVRVCPSPPQPPAPQAVRCTRQSVRDWVCVDGRRRREREQDIVCACVCACVCAHV